MFREAPGECKQGVLAVFMSDYSLNGMVLVCSQDIAATGHSLSST